MKYIYSIHSLERMEDRNISKLEVDSILNNTVDRLIAKSKHDKNALLHMGFVDQRGLVIIVNPNKLTVITVRRMRKKEEAFFKKKQEEEQNE